MKNHLLTQLFQRYLADLRKIFQEIKLDTAWTDLSHEITTSDIRYAVFLGFLGFVPAAVLFQLSTEPITEAMAHFFAAPLQTVITGFLMSGLLLVGSHVMKAPKDYPYAFQIMLRVMAVHPILGFCNYFRLGPSVVLLVYGYLVSRAAVKALGLSFKNAALFFGITYCVFALFQLQPALKAYFG